MVFKLGKKRGDTLVEVMLAVGIFSMVAVAIVSVMSGGTSSSQTALETTLTREEVDNQAEALRFVQQSYIADVRTGQSSPYGFLWSKITERAYNADDVTKPLDEIAQFHPNTCKELYEPSTDDSHKDQANRYGFVLDPRGFVNYEKDFLAADKTDRDDTIKGILRYNNPDSDDPTTTFLTVADTYPHLVYNPGDTTTDLDSSLISDSHSAINGTFYKAQGVYIIAVKDPNNTSLANVNKSSDASAYYDFYIRTCWYGAGDQTPSTISTVIRLYNPDVTTDQTNL